MSVHEGSQGAAYREVTFKTTDGHMLTLYFKPGCGLQLAYFNKAPLQTVRPVAVQPAAITSIPAASSAYVPVEVPREQGSVPNETPPVNTPPVSRPPVQPPILIAPKSNNINDYQRPGTDNTTDSGIGPKPRVIANPVPEPAPVVEQQTQVQTPAVSRPLPNNPISQIISVFNRPGSQSPLTAPRVSPSPNSGINVSGNIGNETSGGLANSGDPGTPR